MAKKCQQKCSSSLTIRELHIKTLRFHFTPKRMAVIKKLNNNKCCLGCGRKAEIIFIAVRNVTNKSTMEINIDIYQSLN